MYATHKANHHMITLIGAVLCLWAVAAFAYCLIGTATDKDWKGFAYFLFVGFVVAALMAGNTTPLMILMGLSAADVIITIVVNVYQMSR